MLIRASNPAFSCGRSPVSLEALSIRLNRLKNRTIEPVINRFPARGTVTRRQIDSPVRNPHRFGPFHGPDSSSVRYPGAQDTRGQSLPQPLPVRRPLTDDENQSPPLAQRPRRHSQHPLAKTTQTPAPTRRLLHQHPTQVQDLVPQQIQQEQDFVVGSNAGLRRRFRLRSRLQRLPR